MLTVSVMRVWHNSAPNLEASFPAMSCDMRIAADDAEFGIPAAKLGAAHVTAIELDHDPDGADDDEYIEEKYWEVQNNIQYGMDALARNRALPLFG